MLTILKKYSLSVIRGKDEKDAKEISRRAIAGGIRNI